LITANQDEFSSKVQNVELINKIGKTLEVKSFECKHMLPRTYVASVENWLKLYREIAITRPCSS